MSSSHITKKALAMSLKELMRTNPLSKITVRNLVENSGLNRQTFYYHFTDIYELVDWIFRTEAVENIKEYKTYETWTDGFYRVFQYIEANKAFCMNTLNSMSRTPLENYLYDVTHDLLRGVVDEICVDLDVEENRKEFVINFYSLAFIGLVVQWMTRGMKENPKRIIGELAVLMQGNFERALAHR